MLMALLQILQMHTFQDTQDQLQWKAGSTTLFMVRSQYFLLQPTQPPDKAVKILWKLRLPLDLLSETCYLHASIYTDIKSGHFHIARFVDPTQSQLHIFFYPAPFPKESGNQYLPA